MKLVKIFILTLLILGASNPNTTATNIIEISCYENQGTKECDILYDVPFKND